MLTKSYQMFDQFDLIATYKSAFSTQLTKFRRKICRTNGKTMSKVAKQKHMLSEIDDIGDLKETQSIVQLVEPRGNNLHEVVDGNGEQYLVSMPTKYRRNVWVKSGNFVIVDPIVEGNKVKAEIVKILTKEHIKYLRSQNSWPAKFDKIDSRSGEHIEDELFVNRNRENIENLAKSEPGSSSSSSDSE